MKNSQETHEGMPVLMMAKQVKRDLKKDIIMEKHASRANNK